MTETAQIAAELTKRLEPSQRVNDSIKFESYDGHRYLNLVPTIFCADGFHMSVQASHTHYCTPRDSRGPWSEVEVGFPSAKVEAFMPYIDGGPDEDPLGTVYGYVPIELIVNAIAEHGGFAAADAAISKAEQS